MYRVFRLVLILFVAFGVVTNADVPNASESGMAMSQMEAVERADDLCVECDHAGFAYGSSCECGCPVPCGSIGSAGILVKQSPARLVSHIGTAIRVAKSLILLGTNPALDPFPPKLPV